MPKVKKEHSVEQHSRVNRILLGPLERPALKWLAEHMPRWMTPDILTGIGFLGAVIIAVSYYLTNYNPAYLWLASFGFVVNWFGDSLDGSLARFRHIERPRYGFFLDHTLDSASETVIFIGLGLSPYVNLELAFLALVGYLLLLHLRFYLHLCLRGIQYSRWQVRTHRDPGGGHFGQHGDPFSWAIPRCAHPQLERPAL